MILAISCCIDAPQNSHNSFVLRSLNASPLMKPFVMSGGWHEWKFVHWKVSVGLKYVRTSSIDSLRNLSPLYTIVSKKIVSVCDISAVNLIVGWKPFAFKRNSSILSLLVSHIDMMSSMNLFQNMGVVLLCLSIALSILAMKILANGYATAIFVSIAVPWDWKKSFLLNWYDIDNTCRLYPLQLLLRLHSKFF